jgi:hypothetical protein
LFRKKGRKKLRSTREYTKKKLLKVKRKCAPYIFKSISTGVEPNRVPRRLCGRWRRQAHVFLFLLFLSFLSVLSFEFSAE